MHVNCWFGQGDFSTPEFCVTPGGLLLWGEWKMYAKRM